MFALAAVALIAVPGPNIIYITTRSLADDRRAGMVSVLGVESGTLIHVAGAAAGLSVQLASSAVAFSIVKYAGAGYLIYLGLRTLLTRDEAGAVAPPRGRAVRSGLPAPVRGSPTGRRPARRSCRAPSSR